MDNNNYQNQNTESINIPPFGNDNTNYQNYNNQNPNFRGFNNPNTTQQNPNNFNGYNQYSNPQIPYNNYRPQPKSNNTALVAAVSILGVLLVAVIIFAALWFSGIIGRPVEPTEPAPIPPSVEEKAPEVEPTSMYVANVKNSIYFRSEPSENSSNIICEIPLHTAVGYVEKTNGTFSKIYYNGSYGYVKTQYLSSQQSSAKSNTSYMTVCNVAHSIYLRSKPVENPNNIICEIPVNSTVIFIEKYNSEFYQISWNGYLGYAKAIYLR